MPEPQTSEDFFEDASEHEKGRVTDKRRVRLDEQGEPVIDEAAVAETKPGYVEELERRAMGAEKKLIEVQARFEQVKADLQRETAELRQRLMRTADERVNREKASFVTALLPALDNLDRAVEAADRSVADAGLLEGLHGTIRGFEMALQSVGVEAIKSVTQPFDPNLHEALDMVPTEPELDGMVLTEYQRGFHINGHVIRPAKVQVGKA